MSDLHYPDLSIEGFRGFRALSIPQLGRVTLITGKNNTGKSSVLEAVHLHTQHADSSTLYNILALREELPRGTDVRERPSYPNGAFPLSGLFLGFPRLPDEFGAIAISTSGKEGRRTLSIRVDWYAEERDAEGTRRFIGGKHPLFGESELVPVLVVATEEGEQIRPLDSVRRYANLGRGLRPRPSDGPRMPCLMVGSYGRERTDDVASLWDAIALTPDEDDVVAALRIIEPRISAVSMVGGETRPSVRTAVVRADHIARPVPLRSFGDGLHRLFAIVLSLVNARGGVLLIDEFENGLHHTVQLDAWRMIFRLAYNLDVQVFATSHSWDAVETFQKAAAETHEDGVLLRLTRRGDDITATVAAEDELAIATRHNIEVR